MKNKLQQFSLHELQILQKGLIWYNDNAFDRLTLNDTIAGHNDKLQICDDLSNEITEEIYKRMK